MLIPNSKIVVLYDFLSARGGAENVYLNFIHTLGASGVVGYLDEALFADLDRKLHKALIRKRGFSEYNTLRTALNFYYSKAVYDTKVDLCLYSGIYSVLSILRNQVPRSLYYCHTPPRFLYDLCDHYDSELGAVTRIGIKIFDIWYREKYIESIRRMNVVIANSLYTQLRLKKYLDTESVVIYPPIECNSYRDLGDEGYYLSMARLEPLKRVELIIEAFLRMPDKKLVVMSGGSLEAGLRSLASRARNIYFTGWLSQQEKIRLLGKCKATIYLAHHEDFGMSPIESMAAGKAVLGVAEGGLLETITHQYNGYLLPPNPTVDDIIEGIKDMESIDMQRLGVNGRLSVKKYDADLFRNRIREIVSKLIGNRYES